MDRKSWPWKKKSSDKALSADANQIDQDEAKIKFVQVTPEAYTRYSELEEQVKTLNEKLSTVDSEMTTKENLVKQHAKVAEEAVSGWEKAEAEASALKHQLESVTLSKLSAEERAAHLDGALKECMKQVRSVKEESEQKLQDVVFTKTKQWERLRVEFEQRITDFEQELLRASAENDALSRSLQERADLLTKISTERSLAEAEVEVLKSSIQSSEREINSLKYELHVVAKELEIRNEEKNMSMRSADVANKQHVEDVKKISKLEAECQRLRGLVRKKLPGPAALAQMKLEVENFARDYGDNKLRRSPAKSLSVSHVSLPPSDAPTFESLQHFRKENEFLTVRLSAMDDETKMLKEALSKQNSELLASRNMLAKTTNRLRSMEAQVSMLSPRKIEASSDGRCSLTSMSEDGFNDDGSYLESSSAELKPDLLKPKKDKSADRHAVMDSPDHLKLMDDFLEMEKLACQSAELSLTKVTEDMSEKESSPSSSSSLRVQDKLETPLSKLRTDIASLLDAQTPHGDISNLRDKLETPLLDVVDDVQQMSRLHQHSPEGNDENKPLVGEELRNALSHIHRFFASIEQIARTSGYDVLCQKVEHFSTFVERAMATVVSWHDVLVELSDVLIEVNEFSIHLSRDKGNESENGSLDCVDKVTLLENVGEHHPIKDSLSDQDFELKTGMQLTCTFEEYEQLKLELVKSNEMMEVMSVKLLDVEREMGELRSQLAASQKSNSLAETQLRCMAESYKLLESRKLELEEEIKILEQKISVLDCELLEEKRNRQVDHCKYNDLREQLERMESLVGADDASDMKAKQETEITEAAKKLAECQETIRTLGRQLQALHPQNDLLPPASPNVWPRMDYLTDDEVFLAANRHVHNLSNQMDPKESSIYKLMGRESQTEAEVTSTPSSPLNAKNQKQQHHRPSRSSSSFPNQLSEKQGRGGFSRFFSKN